MHYDLSYLRQRFLRGEDSPKLHIESCIEAAQEPRCRHVFSLQNFEEARATANADGIAELPLGGVALSIKDMFDVRGQPTAASSQVLAAAPAAAQDCPAVARLRSAGAALIGRTHMVEFAFSGVGVNPHFGTPAAFDAQHGALPGESRIPGGSSSGAAVSVATGAAMAALGSDTGGSLRIPAALNGLVGFKSTARLVPTQGAIPLSTSLDTVGAITRSVRDAMLLHEVLAARKVTRTAAPLAMWRLAVPSSVFLEGMDATVTAAFERTLQRLRQSGARITPIDLPEVTDLAPLQANGTLSAAESYAWHRTLLAEHGTQYDPRVRSRIERGASMLAADYIDLVHARRHWIARMESALSPFDAILSPTVPITAPPISSVAPGDERDAEFFRVNSLLLRNTSVVNMLDGCAISVPCHVAGELPVGLMVWHASLHDDAVLNVAQRIEEALQQAEPFTM